MVIVQIIIQEVLELERDKQIGVGKYERDDTARKGNRNGYKPRSFNTRLGQLHLRKPEIREYRFETQLFTKYQRSERALTVAMQQMVISGVSTARIKKITQKLSPNLSFSKSTISRLLMELDPIVEQWRQEKLNEHYEYIISDAIYLYVRENNKVISRPMMITIGVNKTGHRKVLGNDMYYSENEQSWTSHFQSLKERGLVSTNLTISDANIGQVNALLKVFSGVPHQRCMVHFLRNLQSKVPYNERKILSNLVKQIYQSPNKEMALKIAEIVIESYKRRYPRVSNLLENHLDETLSFYDYPEHHQRKIRTTNLIESLNSQIKRRTRVVNIFPNVKSCIRYVSCLLKEIDEEWQTGRSYMRIEEKKEKDKKNQIMEEMFDRIEQTKKSEIKYEKLTVA